jgi:hypothetical protein
MDNLKVQMAPTGNRGMQLGTISGSVPVNVQTSYCQNGSFDTGLYVYNLSTTMANINSWGFISAGAVQHATICYGSPVTAAYCASMIVGAGYANNVICITRII